MGMTLSMEGMSILGYVLGKLLKIALWTVAVFFLLLVVAYVWGSRTKIDPKRIYELGTLEIGERTFKVPIKLVHFPGSVKEDRREESVLLVYQLPNYTARLDYGSRAAWRYSSKQGHWGQMLLEDASIRPTLTQMVANMRKGKFHEERPLPPDKAMEGLSGTKQYIAQEYKSDIYLRKDKQGLVVDFIDCVVREGTRVVRPSCAHRFVDKGTLYDLTYNRRLYFPKWREMRQSAIALIDGFEVLPQHMEENKTKPGEQ